MWQFMRLLDSARWKSAKTKLASHDRWSLKAGDRKDRLDGTCMYTILYQTLLMGKKLDITSKTKLL
jgi:hypothetical protein